MRNFRKNFSMLAVAAVLAATPVLAMDHGERQMGGGHDAAMRHEGHDGAMQTQHGDDAATMDHDNMDGMDHSGHEGKMVRTASVDGYQLAYHLIDMKAKMAAMPNGHEAMADMPEMKSHHLMMYVTDASGARVEGAEVGYLITGPDQGRQKVMTMTMEGGYGADVDLGSGGYSVKTKIVVGDKTVMDEFTLSAE